MFILRFAFTVYSVVVYELLCSGCLQTEMENETAMVIGNENVQ